MQTHITSTFNAHAYSTRTHMETPTHTQYTHTRGSPSSSSSGCSIWTVVFNQCLRGQRGSGEGRGGGVGGGGSPAMGSSSGLLCTHTPCNCVTYTNSPDVLLQQLCFASAPDPHRTHWYSNYSHINVTDWTGGHLNQKLFFKAVVELYAWFVVFSNLQYSSSISVEVWDTNSWLVGEYDRDRCTKLLHLLWSSVASRVKRLQNNAVSMHSKLPLQKLIKVQLSANRNQSATQQ